MDDYVELVEIIKRKWPRLSTGDFKSISTRWHFDMWWCFTEEFEKYTRFDKSAEEYLNRLKHVCNIVYVQTSKMNNGKFFHRSEKRCLFDDMHKLYGINPTKQLQRELLKLYRAEKRWNGEDYSQCIINQCRLSSCDCKPRYRELKYITLRETEFKQRLYSSTNRFIDICMCLNGLSSYVILFITNYLYEVNNVPVLERLRIADSIKKLKY